MGGVGKTTLAVYYAKMFETAYSGGVFTFNAQSRPSFHQSLRINVSPKSSHQTVPRFVYQTYPLQIARLTDGKSNHSRLEEDHQRFLSLIAKRGNVLLVFDSCDKLSVIDDLLPNRSATVHVLVTTRRSKGSRLLDDKAVNVVRLGRLQDDNAIRATLSWAGRSNDLSSLDEGELSSARALVNASGIQALPLALRHVGTHMKEAYLSYKQYLEVVKKRKQTLPMKTQDMNEFLKYAGLQHIRNVLSEEGIEEVTDVMTADLTQLQHSPHIKPWEMKQLELMKERLQSATAIAWDIDIEEVTKRSPLGRKILDIASLLDRKLIPKDVLVQAAFPDDIENGDDERRLPMAISLLSGFSLLLEDDPCSMHSLVQQSVVEAMMRDGSLSDRLRSLSKCLTTLLPQSVDAIRRSLNDSRVLSLAPHVYTVASHILKSEDRQQECWQLLKIACWLATDSHHLQDAEDLCERRLVYVNNANHQEQVVKHEQLLLCWSTLCFMDYFECANNVTCVLISSALVDLGNVRLKLGRPQLAKIPLEKALDLSRLTGGDQHPHLHCKGKYSLELKTSLCDVCFHP